MGVGFTVISIELSVHGGDVVLEQPCLCVVMVLLLVQ